MAVVSATAMRHRAAETVATVCREEVAKALSLVNARLYGIRQWQNAGYGDPDRMAITKRIIEDHTGSITSRSDPGQGTQFEIPIPLS